MSCIPPDKSSLKHIQMDYEPQNILQCSQYSKTFLIKASLTAPDEESKENEEIEKVHEYQYLVLKVIDKTPFTKGERVHVLKQIKDFFHVEIP